MAAATLADWSQDWLGALDVAIRTEDFYRSLLRRHVLPRWGEHGLADISGIKAAAWAKQLRDQGYSSVTVASVMKLLSLLLSDAADERLIVVNPIRARHRGRRRSDRRVERMWATPSEVLAVADNSARLPIGGPAAAVLIVTAAWTGVRWGEIAALRRDNTHLEDGVIVIDPIIGAMIESSRGLELGPPKTAESARTITLPPFLIPLRTNAFGVLFLMTGLIMLRSRVAAMRLEREMAPPLPATPVLQPQVARS
jgi:integrase